MLSVPPSWVMLAELCAASFLAPTSVLLPASTLPLFTMPWAFILHPGATQTSGLMAAYGRTLRQVELWEDDFQLQQAKAAHQRDAPQAAADSATETVAKRARFSPPPPMHVGFTSGSIDGVVGRMSEPQNLSRAAAFLSEGLIFLSWLSDQCASNKGLITQLTDRLLWDKVTDRTTVLVDAPFLGVCAAVHMEELMTALGTEDPLGLRERILVIYDRPRFVRSAELKEACAALPTPTLHEFLANHFWNLHVVHHPKHPPVDRFTEDLNYKWLQYRWTDEAASLFWDNFDEKASEQEAAYRVDQQQAKRAGKGKTRHFRLALPFHNLHQAGAFDIVFLKP
eukprot:Skav223669  [mRNA]  locus=scaffold2794:282802:283933:- [translate_table: standard]